MRTASTSECKTCSYDPNSIRRSNGHTDCCAYRARVSRGIVMSKKVKIQIISWLNGSILFEYETVDNTVAKTMTKAVNSSANLRYADLSYADLRSADLGSANLSYANLGSANLSYADLRYANLGSADLSYADLSYADLRSADLRYANLGSANLSSANLGSVNLSYADLRSANLGSADLSSANLGYANLSYADLSSADLRYADLRYANLGYANLSSANLSYADLRSANLGYANLSSAKNSKLAVAMTRILPEGTIIGWKKCANSIIVKLEVPANAKRSSAFGRKCRAEYAKVLQIYKAKEAYSSYNSQFVYRKGEIVKPAEPFNDDFTLECSSGIHFYITREEAENHDI